MSTEDVVDSSALPSSSLRRILAAPLSPGINLFYLRNVAIQHRILFLFYLFMH